MSYQTVKVDCKLDDDDDDDDDYNDDRRKNRRWHSIEFDQET